MNKQKASTMKTTKPRREKGVYERVYSHLWSFFDGAFQANSGGHVVEKDFEQFTLGQLQQAEAELIEVAALGISARQLGMLADAGYTMFGQTMQDHPDEPDDANHRLVAYELLDTKY
jgi:hypothetical protein